jgi:branched-chain amino acid transport system ATP-binding protein
MLLDEPAAGLSPAERGSLTDLLLSLDPAVTLLVVEHDMDVALRVAQRVTVMHEGRVVADGTPAEIRASELVHDLYLGRVKSSPEQTGA